eukprot:5092094-Amphidinium_carterae.1
MHDASLAEVLAEMEELEANSSPRFNKINTPDFGVHALKMATDGQTPPMQMQTANFPIPTGSCSYYGHAYAQAPPPGLGSPRQKPSAGMKPQSPPAAAAASPVPDLNFSRCSGTG